MQEHGYIRFYRIPYHIADLKGNTIRIIQSDNRAIVSDPYIQFSAITVCKSNDFFFYVVYHNFF